MVARSFNNCLLLDPFFVIVLGRPWVACRSLISLPCFLDGPSSATLEDGWLVPHLPFGETDLANGTQRGPVSPCWWLLLVLAAVSLTECAPECICIFQALMPLMGGVLCFLQPNFQIRA